MIPDGLFFKSPLERGRAGMSGGWGVFCCVHVAFITHPSAPLKRGFAQALAFIHSITPSFSFTLPPYAFLIFPIIASSPNNVVQVTIALMAVPKMPCRFKFCPVKYRLGILVRGDINVFNVCL